LEQLRGLSQFLPGVDFKWLDEKVAGEASLLPTDAAASAEATLRAAVERHPDDLYLKMALVRFLTDEGQLAPALAEAQACVAQCGQRPDAHAALADVLEKMGRETEAANERLVVEQR